MIMPGFWTTGITEVIQKDDHTGIHRLSLIDCAVDLLFYKKKKKKKDSSFAVNLQIWFSQTADVKLLG